LYVAAEPLHESVELAEDPRTTLLGVMLHARPELLEEALTRSACQQRGVQSMAFECKFDVSDGPQSLIVVPEANGRVPHKKAEIEMSAAQCVANCEMLQSKN